MPRLLQLPGALGAADVPDAVDITNVILQARSVNCAAYAPTYSAAATDVQRGIACGATPAVSPDGATCTFTSNAIPNHDINAIGCFTGTPDESFRKF